MGEEEIAELIDNNAQINSLDKDFADIITTSNRRVHFAEEYGDDDTASTSSRSTMHGIPSDAPRPDEIQFWNHPIQENVIGSLNNNSTTSWFTSSMLIVNAALGAGLLNFPQAFDQAGGVIVAIAVQTFLMLFIIPALVILAYASDFNQANTLQGVLDFTWGKFGKLLASACVALYCFGASITFLIIIGDQFDRVFASTYGDQFCHHWYMNRMFTMISSSIVILLPFCYPKRIDFLRYISSVGVVAVIYVVFLIIAQYFIGDYERGEVKTSPESWTDLFLVIPVICFAYQCHVSVIPIYSCMKDRTVINFTKSSVLAILICVLTYSIGAAFGYLTFGNKVESDILENYDAQQPAVIIAIIAIAIKTFATYPILLFCGREAINTLWIQFIHKYRLRVPNEFTRRIFISTVWFSFSLFLAILLPNIGSIIKLIGSFAALFIFFFPGLCLLRISEMKRNRSLLAVAALFLIFGAFLFGVVLTQGIIFVFYDSVSFSDIPLCKPIRTLKFKIVNVA